MKINFSIAPHYFLRITFGMILSLVASTLSFSQVILNPDLDGAINGSSSLPDFWDSVPFDDPICLATAPISATPDLCDINGPLISLGIFGTPYSGGTFVSALLSQNINYIYHEGIMQTVSGFIPNEQYEISFYQANVKQLGQAPDSAQWSVYFDSTLIGITAPTYSGEIWSSATFPWEQRTLSFIATSTTHTLKFLAYYAPFPSPYSYQLRAGIDYITVSAICESSLTSFVEEACVYFVSPSGNYTWLSSGTYYDTLTGILGCDSIVEIGLTINTVDAGVTQIDDVTLQADIIGAQYQWLNCENNFSIVPGLTNQSATFFQNGSYAVQVSQFDCTDTSSCISINSVGIDENSIDNLHVFPNPVKSDLNIHFNNAPQKTNIEMMDLSGRIVLTKVFFDECQLKLNIEHFSKGNYILIIKSNESLTRIKIMKD